MPRYRGPTRMPSCARSSIGSGAASAPSTCSSTRTTTSTGRRRRVQASASTNTLLICRWRFMSWVVLGTLVTTAEARVDPARSTSTAGRAGSASKPVHTEALDEAGTDLDVTRVFPTGRNRGTRFPWPYRRSRRSGLRMRHLPNDLPVEPGDRARRGERFRRRRSRPSHHRLARVRGRRPPHPLRAVVRPRATTLAICAAPLMAQDARASMTRGRAALPSASSRTIRC